MITPLAIAAVGLFVTLALLLVAVFGPTEGQRDARRRNPRPPHAHRIR